MTSQPNLKRTPLYEQHLSIGARFVSFAGYEMPIQYTGLVDEHQAVRETAGLFDVSHMGEFEIRGPQATKAADTIVTNNIEKLKVGQACYTVMCNQQGHIIDDLIVYKRAEDNILLCVNASNREKDFEHVKNNVSDICDVSDTSDNWALIAVQGPLSQQLLQQITPQALSDIAYYHFAESTVAGTPAIISRTGYTGEPGFELYIPSDSKLCGSVWEELYQKGQTLGIKPAGLGARDSLRLEMCFPLYGQELDETTNPYEAGLGWVVKLKKSTPFIGQAALQEVKTSGPQRKLVSLTIQGRAIARPGYPILDGDTPIGKVTSGTHSPTLNKPIALAYVPTAYADIGRQLCVQIRGRPIEAIVTERPFIKKTS